MVEILHSNELSGGKKGLSSQKYVDVDEIQNGAVILKDRSLRAILLVSSINFDLKSTDEQDAIIAQYQNFLNSLDFPLQIVVSSRKLNIEPYIELLKERTSQQENELLKMQISEYMAFIRNLTDVSQIMSKYFYIVVPFHPVENIKKGTFDKFVGLFGGTSQKNSEKQEEVETYKNQLWQRVDQITSGLSGIGVKVAPLNTEEIIELLYNSYNPSETKNNSIKNISDIEIKKM